jgi:hypothetical protein
LYPQKGLFSIINISQNYNAHLSAALAPVGHIPQSDNNATIDDELKIHHPTSVHKLRKVQIGCLFAAGF